MSRYGSRQNRAGAAAVKARKALAASRAQADSSKRQSQRSTSTPWVCRTAVVQSHRATACVATPASIVTHARPLGLRAKRAAAISARRQAEAAWEGAGMDPEFFRSMVLPALATAKLLAIVEACGVAKGHGVKLANGEVDPASLALVKARRAGER